jgi:hypothetical protein
MVARARSHLLAATAFAVLAGACLGAGPARAQDATCLASPNGAAPAGTHWYYKTDQATHQKCWYTRSQAQAAQAAPAETTPSRTAPSRTPIAQADPANPDADATPVPEESAAPVAFAPSPPPIQEHAAPLAPAAPRRAVPPIARVPVPAADPRGENQPVTTAAAAVPAATGTPATSANVAWPDPPSMPQAAGVAGSTFPPPPSPPPPSVGSQADPSGAVAAAQAPSPDGSTAANGVSAAADPTSNASGQKPSAETPDSGGAAGNSDTPVRANPPGRVSVLLVLAGLILLLVVGMLLRRLVEHALSRRRVINLARQEPRLVEALPVPPPVPTLLRHAPSVVPGPAQAQQRASEVEAELRKFAQNLRQRRPAANGTLGRSGAAIRS